MGFGWIAAYFLSQYGNWPFVISGISVVLALVLPVYRYLLWSVSCYESSKDESGRCAPLRIKNMKYL